MQKHFLNVYLARKYHYESSFLTIKRAPPTGINTVHQIIL